MHDNTDQDDEFGMLTEPEDERPPAEVRFGLVTGYPLSSAELTAKYTSPEYDQFQISEEPTYFSDAETGELTAVMHDRELNTTLEVTLIEGVPPDDTDNT